MNDLTKRIQEAQDKCGWSTEFKDPWVLYTVDKLFEFVKELSVQVHDLTQRVDQMRSVQEDLTRADDDAALDEEFPRGFQQGA